MPSILSRWLENQMKVTETASLGHGGRPWGHVGQGWALGMWQFVCKQVTSWHSVGRQQGLGKRFSVDRVP